MPRETGEVRAPMTLHEAIRLVLQAKQPLLAEEIGEEIRARSLYIRGDSDPPPEDQVRWRIRNHPELFEVVPGSSPQMFRLVESGEPTADEAREKLVFYVKCRPRGLDMWKLAEAYKRVFIGYPPWRRLDEEPGREEWPETIQDISSPHFDNDAIRDKAWRPTITANRHLSRRVGQGSIVLVPRPGDGICHVGRVAGPFEIFSDEAYVSAALAYKNQHYESDLDLWGDVAQTWPVEGWITVPFPYLPGWIRYRLLSQNTVGEIKHRDGLAVMERLRSDPTSMPVDWFPTSDVNEVHRRLEFHVTPAGFEHLVVDLLQLEHEGEHWLHIGGSGDGGADGIGYDHAGKVTGIVQCKWRPPSRPIAVPETAGWFYVATLSRGTWKYAPARAEMLYGQDVARMLIRHADRLPIARALGVRPRV